MWLRSRLSLYMRLYFQISKLKGLLRQTAMHRITQRTQALLMQMPTTNIPANKQSLVASVKGHENPVRTMSHVVEVYNQQGKVRIKFMDSKNNTIYQIPTEMVAKMEDLMMKPETATNIKG